MVEAKCGRIAARHVVITADHNSVKFPHQLNHVIRVCAIANNVAEIPHGVILGRGGKHRFEGGKIGVDVGDHEYAHIPFSPAVAGCTAVLTEPFVCSRSELRLISAGHYH